MRQENSIQSLYKVAEQCLLPSVYVTSVTKKKVIIRNIATNDLHIGISTKDFKVTLTNTLV